jgi:hypothetical protein
MEQLAIRLGGQTAPAKSLVIRSAGQRGRKIRAWNLLIQFDSIESGVDRRNGSIVRIVTSARVLSDREAQCSAMRLGCLGVRRKVVLKLAGEALARGVNLRNDRVVPHGVRGIHGEISMSSNGVTNSGRVKPRAAHKPRIIGKRAGLAMWVLFHVSSTSIS